jgi:ribonuclease D
VNREEILERIRIGEEYLDRDNLTPKQRKQAEERYTDLVARLAEMPEPEEPKEPEQLKTADPKVLECMNKIRSILGMPLRQEDAS